MDGDFQSFELKKDGLSFVICGDRTAKVTGIDKSFEGVLIIPASIEYEGEVYTITTITSGAISECSKLTKIMIPKSIVSIDSFIKREETCCQAMSRLVRLKGMSIERAEIDKNVFPNCNNLTCVVVDKENPNYKSENGILLSKDGTKILQFPKGIIGCVKIPNGVTDITEGLFEDCKNLKEIILPKSVQKVEFNTFSGCRMLQCIRLSTNVAEITHSLLFECDSLMAIEVDIENQMFKSVDGILLNKAGTEILYIPKRITGDVKLPEGITKIADYAFSGCEELISVTVPSSVIEIGKKAFYNCKNLKYIKIEEGVTKIKAGAFYNCRSLNDITIPESVKEIEKDAFSFCFLKSIYFLGNAPKLKHSCLDSHLGIIYYNKGKNGWRNFKCHGIRILKKDEPSCDVNFEDQNQKEDEARYTEEDKLNEDRLTLLSILGDNEKIFNVKLERTIDFLNEFRRFFVLNKHVAFTNHLHDIAYLLNSQKKTFFEVKNFFDIGLLKKCTGTKRMENCLFQIKWEILNSVDQVVDQKLFMKFLTLLNNAQSAVKIQKNLEVCFEMCWLTITGIAADVRDELPMAHYERKRMLEYIMETLVDSARFKLELDFSTELGGKVANVFNIQRMMLKMLRSVVRNGSVYNEDIKRLLGEIKSDVTTIKDSSKIIDSQNVVINNENVSKDKLLHFNEIAEYYGVQVGTVYKWKQRKAPFNGNLARIADIDKWREGLGKRK